MQHPRHQDLENETSEILTNNISHNGREGEILTKKLTLRPLHICEKQFFRCFKTIII